MQLHDLSQLSKGQVGRLGEYWAKVQLTLCGLDVYTSEVDDKGIDFVVCTAQGIYVAVQVKSIRKPGWVYFRKEHFVPGPQLWTMVNLFFKGQDPTTLLIPSVTWLQPTAPFAVKEFTAGIEYGINVSKKALPTLAEFNIAVVRDRLRDGDFT